MPQPSIEVRLQQLYESLSVICDDDYGDVEYFRGIDPDTGLFTVRANFDASEAKLLNSIEKLIENIARLGDHLENWCEQHGAHFDRAAFIRSHPDDVAIIQDLWNVQKHAGPARTPWSGRRLHLEGLVRGVLIDNRPGAPGFSLTLSELIPVVEREGPGQAELSTTGRVVDETGQVIGDVRAICKRAIEAWEGALRTAGLTITSAG
jgi:hypothetical protein